MNKLYVISKYDNYSIIRFNSVSVIEENEKEFILSDRIFNKKTFLKENLDKEFEFLFVTKDKRKIRKQLRRIYNNIENNANDEISYLEYKVNKLKSFQERNKENYNSVINFLNKKN